MGVLLLLLVVFPSLAWICRSTDLAKARELQIGQTRAEAFQVMGRTGPPIEADSVAFSTTHRLLEPVRRLAFLRFGFQTRDPDFEEFPVTVHFDANGRVDRIKRGSEIIEAPKP
jgi:hypothetical protein